MPVRGGNPPPWRHRGTGGIALVFAVLISVSVPLIPGESAGATPGTAIPDPEGPRVLAGIEQVYVTGLPAGDVVTISRSGPKSPKRGQQAGTAAPVATATVDRLGSVVFRNLAQGARYVVHDQTSGWTARTKVLVAGDDPPESFYRATVMGAGLNYIRMRDGITLAATVRPPLGRRLGDGPFPTVIEYSGYQVAAPGDAVTNILGMALGLPNDPLAPTG